MKRVRWQVRPRECTFGSRRGCPRRIWHPLALAQDPRHWGLNRLRPFCKWKHLHNLLFFITFPSLFKSFFITPHRSRIILYIAQFFSDFYYCIFGYTQISRKIMANVLSSNRRRREANKKCIWWKSVVMKNSNFWMCLKKQLHLLVENKGSATFFKTEIGKLLKIQFLWEIVS